LRIEKDSERARNEIRSIRKILSCSEAAELLHQYQDPATADPVAKVEKELQETKEVLTEAMDELIKRGGSLEELTEKCDDLSVQTKVFVKSAKKTNSCCMLL